MVAVNIIDYITGLVAAPYRKDGGISSYKSIRGIAKKGCNVAACSSRSNRRSADRIYNRTVRVELPSVVFGCLLSGSMIICNELISILENIKDIGVVIPRWLLPLIKQEL